MKFQDSSGEFLTLQQIANNVSADYDYQVFVGTDSQVRKDKKLVTYATCIVLYKKGKGGRIFVSKKKTSLSNSLKDRLMKEVWRSLETSLALSPLLPKNVEVIIHIDVNGSTKFKSGKYHQELISMVTGQGYKIMIKPEAFAAQNVADRFSKA